MVIQKKHSLKHLFRNLLISAYELKGGKLKPMTTKRHGRTIRTQGRRSGYKKTIITLQDGYSIDFVSGEVES